MIYSIYADETLFLNTVINYFLFLSSLRLAHMPIRRRRALAAALLASLYALGALVPSLRLCYIFPLKCLFALLFAYLAAGRSRRVFLVWALFLAFSLLFGGAVTALTLLLHAATPLSFSGMVFLPASLRAAAVLSCGIYYFVALFFRTLLPVRSREIRPCEIVLNHKSVTFPLLSDTGAGVYDPASGLAIPIVSPSAVRPLFSEADFFLITSLSPPDAVVALKRNSVSFGLLPVTTAAKSALLLTFRADAVTVGNRTARGIPVAVASGELAPDGDFSGVIAPQ